MAMDFNFITCKMYFFLNNTILIFLSYFHILCYKATFILKNCCTEFISPFKVLLSYFSVLVQISDLFQNQYTQDN